MAYSDRMTRRTVIRTAGIATATVALAGCTDESSVDDPDESTGEGTPADGRESESDDAGDADRSNGDGDESPDGAEGRETAPLRIELRGELEGWRALAPDRFEGDVNPNLSLEAGRTCRIGWTEGDGLGHNVEIRDADGEVVDGLSTPVTREPGEDQWLEFEVSEEMAAYVCMPHEDAMRGEIRVESGSAD